MKLEMKVNDLATLLRNQSHFNETFNNQSGLEAKCTKKHYHILIKPYLTSNAMMKGIKLHYRLL